MSGTLPTSPEPASVELTSLEPTAVSTAHNLRKIRRSRGVQRWQLDVAYAPMTREEFGPLYAFMIAQAGQSEAFDAVIPPLSTPQGTTGSDTPTVNGAHAAGLQTVATTGWTISTLVLKAGDIIRFAGHAKVYMVTQDATSDGSGNVTLTIRPKLTIALVNTESLTVRDVPFQVTLATDATTASLTPGVNFGFDMKLVETL